MTHRDIYIKFMIGYDKANVTSSYPSLTEYEVATFLDKAYLALIAQKVTGNNSRHIGFEQDLKVTEDLGPLIKTLRVFRVNTKPLPYVHNALSCDLPSDWLYFVSGELKRKSKTYDLQLVSHQVASKFYTTAYNIPWVKRPVCYIEDGTIYTLYDSIYQASGNPDLSFTYIKMPKKFMVDDNKSQDAENSEGYPPYAYAQYITETGQPVDVKNGDSIVLKPLETVRIFYQNGSSGEVLPEFSSNIVVDMQTSEDGGCATATAKMRGNQEYVALKNSDFPNWSFFIYIEIDSDEEELAPPVIDPTEDQITYVDEMPTIHCYYDIVTDNPAETIPEYDVVSDNTEVLQVINKRASTVILSAKKKGTATIKITSPNHKDWKPTIKYEVLDKISATNEFNVDLGDGMYYVKGDIDGLINPIFKLEDTNVYACGIPYLSSSATPYKQQTKYVYCYDETRGDIVTMSSDNSNIYDIIKLKIIHALRTNYSFFATAGSGIKATKQNPTAYILLADEVDPQPSATDLHRSIKVGQAANQVAIQNGTPVSAIVENSEFLSATISGNNVLVTGLKATSNTKVAIFTATGSDPIIVTYEVGMDHDLIGHYFAINFHGDPNYSSPEIVVQTPLITALTISNSDILLQSSNKQFNQTGQYSLNATLANISGAEGNLYVVVSNNTSLSVGSSLSYGQSGCVYLESTYAFVSGNVSVSTQTLRVYLVDNGTVILTCGTISYQQLLPATLSLRPASVQDVTYDGNSHAAIQEGVVSGGTLKYRIGESGEYSPAIPTVTNAGTYTVYYKVEADTDHTDGTGTSGSCTFTINKRVLNVNWTDDQFVYDGSPHVPSASPVGVITGDNIELSVSGVSSSVGTHTATAVIRPNGYSNNYQLSNGQATHLFTIITAAGLASYTNGYYDLNSGSTYQIKLTDSNVNITDARVADGSTSYVEVNSWSTGQVTVEGLDAGTGTVLITTEQSETPIQAVFHVHPVVNRTRRTLRVGETDENEQYIVIKGSTATGVSMSASGYVTATVTDGQVFVEPIAETSEVTLTISTVVGENVLVIYTVQPPLIQATLVSDGDVRTLIYDQYETVQVNGTIHHCSTTTPYLDQTENQLNNSYVEVHAIGATPEGVYAYLKIWLEGSTNTLNNSTTPDITIRYTISPKGLTPKPEVNTDTREVTVGTTDYIDATNGTIDHVYITEPTANVDNYIAVQIVNGRAQVFCRNVCDAYVRVVTNNGDIYSIVYRITAEGINPYIDGNVNRTIYTDRTIETIKVIGDTIRSAVSTDTNVVTTSSTGSSYEIRVLPQSSGTCDVNLRTSGGYSLVVHYTVLQAPTRPYLTRSGDALTDGADYNYLAVGETDTIILNSGTSRSWYTTGGVGNQGASNFATLNANAYSATIKGVSASNNPLIHVVVTTNEPSDGDGNQHIMIPYFIVQYLPLEYPGVKIVPLTGMTERTPSQAYVGDTIFDTYFVLNASIQGQVGSGNTTVNLEYPIFAIDSTDVKAVVKYDSSTNKYKYLCKTQGGYELSSVEESSDVSLYLTNQVKRTWRKYGDRTGTMITAHSDTVKLGSNTNINVTEYINPMYIAPQS